MYYEHPASEYRRKSHYYRAGGCKHSDGLQSHPETHRHTQSTYTIHTHTHGMDKLPNTHRARAKYAASEALTQSADKLLPVVILSSLVRQYSFLKEPVNIGRGSVFLIFWQFEPLNMFFILSLNCS